MSRKPRTTLQELQRAIDWLNLELHGDSKQYTTNANGYPCPRPGFYCFDDYYKELQLFTNDRGGVRTIAKAQTRAELLNLITAFHAGINTQKQLSGLRCRVPAYI